MTSSTLTPPAPPARPTSTGKVPMASLRSVSVRNLAAHKVRLVLTVVAVVLGTAFITGSFVFTDTLKATFDKIITVSDKGLDVQVSPRKDTSAGVPVSLVPQLQAIPGVKAVQPQIQQTVVLVGADGKKIQGGGAPTIGGSWFPPDESITPAPTFVAGTAPTSADQVVINEGAAKFGHVKVGDQVRVILLSGAPLTETVTGIYHTSIDTGGYVGVLFEQSEALKIFTDGRHVDTIGMALNPGVSQQSVRDQVAALLPADLQAKTGDQVRADDQSALSKALSFVNIFLLAFGGIALLVGTFIIYNTFSMIVAQRLRELALLRAIGADRKQIRRSVLFEAGIIGVIGSVIGVVGGVGLAYGLRAFLNAINTGLPNGTLQLKPRTVIVAIIVGTGVTLLSAYSPARRAAKIPPVAAMREEFATTTSAGLRRRNIIGAGLLLAGIVATVAGVASRSAGSGASLIGLGLVGVAAGVMMLAPMLAAWIIGPLGRVIGRPFGTVGRLARTNAIRNPRRTAATAFALTLGLLLVSGIAVVGASSKASLNSIVDNEVRADYILNANEFGVPIAAAAAARKVPGVASVTEIHGLAATVNGSSSVSGGSGVDGPLDVIVKVTMLHGGGAPTGNSMLISKKTGQDKGWGVGTHVTLGEPGGTTVTETVTGVYADSLLLGPWLVSGDVYRQLTPSNEYVDEVALVHAVPGTDLTQLGTALTAATAPYYVVDVQNREQFKGQQADMVNSLLGILYGLLALAIVIAVLGIVNTLALSVVERRREIGMLRAVGMQRAQVRRTIYLESALIAMFGAVLGLAIGLTFGVLFTRTLASAGLKSLSVPWVQAVLFFVVAGVVGVAAALWPGIRAARTRPLAAISEG